MSVSTLLPRAEKLVWLLPAMLLGLAVAYNPLLGALVLLNVGAIWLMLEKPAWVLIFLICYLPFQVALNVTPGVDLASGRVLIVALFGVWLVRALKNRKLIINFSLQTLLLFLFLLLASLSILWAAETDRALRKILVLFSVLPLYFILTSFKSGKTWERILQAMFLSLLLLSLIALLQFFAQFIFGLDAVLQFWQMRVAPIFLGNTFTAAVVSNPSWLVNLGGRTVMRALAVLPDPHIFSFYVGMIIPPVFALAQFPLQDFNTRHVLFRRASLGMIVILGLAAEMLTFSRGGYVGLVCALVVMLMLLFSRFSRAQKLAWALASVFPAAVGFWAGGAVWQRFWSIFNWTEGSNAARFVNWRQGWDLFSEHWALGTGLGNYSYALNPALSYREPVYAHNLYLDLGAEMGLVTLIVYVLLIGVTVWQLWHFSRRTQKLSEALLAVGLIGSWVWFSAHAFFDTPFFSPQILGIWTVILALSVWLVGQDKSVEAKSIV